MKYPSLDINLTGEQQAGLDMARKFGMEVARPKGIELDSFPDPQQVIDKGSPLWDVIATYRELGLHKATLPKAVGGMAGDIDPYTHLLIREQIGYADAGLAISLGAAGSPFGYAAWSGDPEIQGWAKDYINDTSGEIIGCWAITEPDHGSDWVNMADPAMARKASAPQVKAVKKGKEYVLTGQKSSWVSNGTLATHASLHVSLAPELGMQGTGVCVLPLDLPGITKGKPLNKLGQRALNQGEIFFEEVVIPEKYMMADFRNFSAGGNGGGSILAGANTGMSITFGGVALSAFDEALRYASERIQGGVPIMEHQNIKLKLMKMFQMTEAARSLSRRTHAYNQVNPPGSMAHAVAAKALSTETAFNVASEAIQIFGGNGLSKEYCIEKIFRDARASMIEDGTNEVLLMAGAQYI